MGAIASVVERVDTWVNAMTGLGTLRDKLAHHEALPSDALPDSTLETLYTDDDICARIVEKLPRDAVREGFGLKLDSEDNDDATSTARDLVEAVKALDGLRKLREAWIWARLYGAGAVLIGADDGHDLSEPLEIERVKTVTFLTVLRRTQLQRESWYDDIGAARYGEPKTFRIVQTGSSQGTAATSKNHLHLVSDAVVHESRLLYFRGVMTTRLPAQGGQFWDDSVLQRVHEVIKHSSSSWMSAAHLMTDASQGVLKIANLMQMLSTGGESLLRKRMTMMDLCRNVCRAILIDADKESFERVPTSFAGIPELLDRFMTRVAAAAGMPVTVLFGISPAGLNATGASDMRNWYDAVAAERADVLLPKLEQLVRLVMATDGGPTAGEVLDGWEITFPPLWQETAAEKATTFKTECDALGVLITAQVAQPEECALRIAHSGVFPELDVASREAALKVVLERVANPPDPNELPPPPDPNAPPDDPNAPDPAA